MSPHEVAIHLATYGLIGMIMADLKQRDNEVGIALLFRVLAFVLFAASLVLTFTPIQGGPA